MSELDAPSPAAGFRSPLPGPGNIPRNRRRGLAVLLPAALLLAGPVRAASPSHPDLDRIVDRVVARYHLPGLAVGVIEDGRVVYTRTVGEREAGSGKRIDADTLFKIASNSKAMTTALLGRLVDAGKLRWNDPVTRYLPDFRMHDPWVTKQMRVADLLTHSSGLPEGGGDLMLWPEPNAFTRADIVHGLRYIAPGYSFRSKYQYDNLLYVVAGRVAAVAGGAPYETLMRREVFAPLGLDRCVVGAFDRDAVGDLAQPHARRGDRNVVVHPDPPQVPAITSAPAGGIRCSLTDMLAWARNWLAPTPAQLEWLSAKQRRVLQSPHMLIPVSARRREWDRTHIMAYGYGWRMADVDGNWTVWHTGTLSGMYSELMLVPDRRDGFVLLINGEAEDARTVLGEALLKRLVAPHDPRTVDDYADALDREAAQRPPSARKPDTSAQRPADPGALAAKLGHFRDPWFGAMTLCRKDDRVRFVAAKSPRMRGTLMQLRGRYLVHWDDGGVDPDAWLDFGSADGHETVRMAKVDPQGDFSSDYEDLRFVREGGCD